MLSEPLVELALRPWGRPRVGLIQHSTPERLVELWPSFPMPGPNHVCLVRCAPERVDPMIDETLELAAAHGLRCMWILDPGAQPADIGVRLTARGIPQVEELDVMVLPVGTTLARGDPAIEIVDGLRDEATYQAAEAVQSAAFQDAGPLPGQPERFAEACADPSRRLFLALVGSQPAGAGWATVHQDGILLNGGAVHPRFQGCGVYRALVAARLGLARELGAAGVGVQAKSDTSGPILSRFGFRTVGRWRLHADGGG